MTLSSRLPWILGLIVLFTVASASVAAAPDRISELHFYPRHVLRVFRPAAAFGVAIDGGDAAESAALFNPANSAAIRQAQFHDASYRLRTELAGQVWHWTSYGRWSNLEHQEGYWTGDPSRDDNQKLSYGYRLPRRGNSRDEADDDGYSRIDDGDPTSFWKSNPYLDPKLDGLGVERQWVIVDLGDARAVDTVRIQWGEPYAAQFSVQRWVGDDQYDGKWIDLTPTVAGHTGDQLIQFQPTSARFLRLVLAKSSHLAAGSDPRDAMGYAISELQIGRTFRHSFYDYVRHLTSGTKQTQIFVSSTDPWHRKVDRDPDAVQPSLVQLHARGLFSGPFMIALPLLTDTPDNAANQLRYLRRRGVPLKAVELGEEPEGQRAPPEMVAALYERMSLRIANDFPDMVIGGPSLIDPSADTTLDDRTVSWTLPFLQSLRRAHPTAKINFLSTDRTRWRA